MANPGSERLKLVVSVVAAMAIVAGLSILVAQQFLGARHGKVEVVPPATPEAKLAKVYVSGAVVRPGVYPLKEGDRVEDAVRAAGGPSDEADLERLNLAALVRDEMHVTVPSQVIGTEGDHVVSAPATPDKVDINTASLADLDKLPGIGPVTAGKIVDYRTRNGPFVRVEQLRDLKIVTSATWEKIKDLVVAR